MGRELHFWAVNQSALSSVMWLRTSSQLYRSLTSEGLYDGAKDALCACFSHTEKPFRTVDKFVPLQHRCDGSELISVSPSTVPCVQCVTTISPVSSLSASFILPPSLSLLFLTSVCSFKHLLFFCWQCCHGDSDENQTDAVKRGCTDFHLFLAGFTLIYCFYLLAATSFLICSRYEVII